MKADWPEMPISEVATPVARGEEVVATNTYRQIGVRLWGNGAYDRGEILGRDTKYKTLFRMTTNDIVVNKIWARNGSVAVVPDELDGTYGSGEFPVFAPDESQLIPRWFHWITQWKPFWSQCDEKSRGATGKNRIKPSQFLEVTIPLPPLPEQRRIVAKLDKIAALAGEARRLAGRIAEEQDFLLKSAYRESLKHGSTKIMMRDCVSQARRPVVIKDELAYKQVTVSLHFKGVSQRQIIFGEGIKTKQQYLIKSGDFIFSRIDARNGAFGFVPKELDGAIVTGDFPCFEVNESVIKKEVLGIVLRMPQFVHSVLDASRGVTNRRRFKEAQLLGIEIEVPSMADQEKIAYISVKLWKSRTIHQQTAVFLEALMPALLDQAFRGEL